MLFFISQAQAIDDVLLMQSIGNDGFNKLRKYSLSVRHRLGIGINSFGKKLVATKTVA